MFKKTVHVAILTFIAPTCAFAKVTKAYVTNINNEVMLTDGSYEDDDEDEDNNLKL